jgi:site-specific DNA-methyltransferase (adenine-specific)
MTGRGQRARKAPRGRGHALISPPSEAPGPGFGTLKGTGPTNAPEPSPRIAPHRHGTNWNLCDRSYVLGKRRHLIRETYGSCRPTLFAPELRSGIAEDVLPRLTSEAFDLIYLDPPYGTTSAEWDRVPDWNWLGEQTARLLRPTGQVVLHGSGAMALEAAATFLGHLEHRFQIVWVKGRTGGPLRSSPWISDLEPLRAHEMIHVFKRKGAKTGDLTFNLGAMHRRGKPWRGIKWHGPAHHESYGVAGREYSSDGWRYPVDVVFSSPSTEGDLFAAKPEDLVTLLIATLTKAGDRVLDPYAGSGTTLKVCHKLGRRSLGIDASPRSWAIMNANLSGIFERSRTRTERPANPERSPGILRRGRPTRIPRDSSVDLERGR